MVSGGIVDHKSPEEVLNKKNWVWHRAKNINTTCDFLKYPHIGGIEIIFYFITWIKTPKDRMIQPSNISRWETHQIWIQKMVRDQDMSIYRLEIKWPSITSKFVCLRSHMWIQYVRCRATQIYIWYFDRIKTTSDKKKWCWYNVWS